MGRHSAPDADEPDVGSGSAVLVEDDAAPLDETGDGGGRDGRRGRHTALAERADEPPEPGGLDLIEDVLVEPDVQVEPDEVAEGDRPLPSPAADRGAPDAADVPADPDEAPTTRLPAITVPVAEGTGAQPWDETDRIAVTLDRPHPGPGSRADEPVAQGDTDVADRLDLAVAAPPTPPVAGQQPRAARRGTAADIDLVRQHGDVRARVIAAVLVPFLVFFATFAVAQTLDLRSLIWIWIPAIVAGVLVGLLLDAGHRRYPAGPATDPADPPAEPGSG